ncbi:MAG: alpha/beta hydrolase [Candidatus Microsaccharimonas sp.]
MKTVLFVPGYQEDIDSRDYRATIRAIEKKGYKVKFVPINWVRTTIDHWVEEFDRLYEKYDPKETILAGFSYGAMTVFLSAIKKNPSALWLFSLSPFFSEDLKSEGFKQSWLRQVGHRRVDTFKKLSFTKLVKKISVDTILFYGDMELKTWSDISYRDRATKALPKMKKVIIKGAKHDVSSNTYIAAIKETI